MLGETRALAGCLPRATEGSATGKFEHNTIGRSLYAIDNEHTEPQCFYTLYNHDSHDGSSIRCGQHSDTRAIRGVGASTNNDRYNRSELARRTAVECRF